MTLDAIKKKYGNLVDATQSIVAPIFARIQDHNEEVMDKEYGSTEDGVYTTCGTMRKVKKLDAIAKKKGREKVKEISSEVEDLPMHYPEAMGQTQHNRASKGTHMGKREKAQLPPIGVPQWVKDLKGIVKNFGKAKRRRGRDYYDIESLVRNVPEKQPEKKLKRQDYIFTIIDTSGSMWATSPTGRTYLQEMSKYIIPIAQEFDGRVFMPSDYMEELVINVNYFENKDLRKAFKTAGDMAQMNIVGGGNLNALPAYEEIMVEIQENNNVRPLVITLTDGYEDFPAKEIRQLRTSIFVMPESSVDSFKRQNRGVAELVDDPDFPLVSIIPIKFNKR